MSAGSKIEKILDEEKRLLLKGDFVELEKISELKLKASEIIEKNSLNLSVEQVQRITRKAYDNEALLKSARRGIQAAMMHLRDATDESFKSYSKEGQRKPLSKTKLMHQKL
ncbi:MAG: hypothetical protein HKN27_16730 [Silicimonas sp.]|nr:hypothetical protein [Silicimonas sp.]